MNRFPVPDFRAEEAARDFASDVRKLGREALAIKEAIERGEADQKDREKYAQLCEDIQLQSGIVFVCEVTHREYRVGDYVTKGNEIRAKLRESILVAGYRRLKQALLH